MSGGPTIVVSLQDHLDLPPPAQAAHGATQLSPAAAPFSPQEALLAKAEKFYRCGPGAAEPGRPSGDGCLVQSWGGPAAAPRAAVLAAVPAQWLAAAPAPPRPPSEVPHRAPLRTPSPQRSCGARAQQQGRLAAGPGRSRSPDPAPWLPLVTPSRTPSPGGSTAVRSYCEQVQEAVYQREAERMKEERFQEFVYLRYAGGAAKPNDLDVLSTTMGDSDAGGETSTPSQGAPSVVSLAQASAHAAGSSGSGIVAAAQKFMCSFLGSGAGQFGAGVPADDAAADAPDDPPCSVSACASEDEGDPSAWLTATVKNTFVHVEHSPGSRRGRSSKASSSMRRYPSAPAVLASDVVHLKYPTMETAHVRGECKPCAYFLHKGDGCHNGDNCSFCHLCAEGERIRRKKERAKRVRMLKAARVRGQHPRTGSVS